MALPLLPILLIGGAAVAVAMSAGGGGGGPGEGKQMVPWIGLDYDKELAKWRASKWGERVDVLRVELEDPDDVAVTVAHEILPGFPWPATKTMPESNQRLWKQIKMDVWSYLGIEEHPFPPG
jgi:hypothetical protein